MLWAGVEDETDKMIGDFVVDPVPRRGDHVSIKLPGRGHGAPDEALGPLEVVSVLHRLDVRPHAKLHGIDVYVKVTE